MKIEDFGTLQDGRKVQLYTLANENISVSLTDLGASIVRFIDQKSGTDIVLGYDDAGAYESFPNYFGASIGRIANRVKDGLLTIDGKTYQLPKNERGNHIHGGYEGFDKKIFTAEADETSVRFRYVSPDGEEGYPGELAVTITYELLADGLRIIPEGSASDDTVFAYTNHGYYNLAGKGEITSHRVQVFGDCYAPNDEKSMALDELIPVDDTAFDLRKGSVISDVLSASDEQIRLCHGLDHHFPVQGEGLRLMSRYSTDKLTLEMWSDFPGLHVYTPNFKDHRPGKGGDFYDGRYAICFEAEYYPNGVNYESVKEKPFVKKGETLRHEIVYRLV